MWSVQFHAIYFQVRPCIHHPGVDGATLPQPLSLCCAVQKMMLDVRLLCCCRG